ncbi:hypothetical protein V9744_05410, partial [Escherichia coli]
KTSIFSHPVYLFLRKFSLQDSRGGSKTIDTKRRKMENQFNSLKAASGRAYDALRVISAVDRGTSSSSQTLPQSEQVSQPAASSNFSSLWGD